MHTFCSRYFLFNVVGSSSQNCSIIKAGFTWAVLSAAYE